MSAGRDTGQGARGIVRWRWVIADARRDLRASRSPNGGELGGQRSGWGRVASAVPDGEHNLWRPEDIAMLLGVVTQES
jgi:hypothetical protein